MDKFIVKGPCALKGEIKSSASKNAALPLLFATLLSDKTSELKNVPVLQDMESTKRMLLHFGCKVQQNYRENFGSDWTIDTSAMQSQLAPYDLVRKMRASILCMGPLLAAHGIAKVSMPGGCAIGSRPIDLHLQAFKKMGAVLEQKSGYLQATCASGNKLQGAHIVFPKVSVGATENILMAAVLAKGSSRLENVAREPEITALAKALQQMGAKIQGLGTSCLEVEGVETLNGMNFTIPADRIEIGTYLIGAQMSGGQIKISPVNMEDIALLCQSLEETGAKIKVEGDSVTLTASEKIKAVNQTTAPFPAFATDLQAQWVALMTQAEGDSVVTENIFENRFMHVPELKRMGAQLECKGSSVYVKGKAGSLQGAPVMATDLRASASLVLAGLVAKGETEVKRIYHLDRGYEFMELKLRALGANVERAVDL